MKIHWWEDSSGRHTCHRNVPGLTASESYVGHLTEDLDGSYYVLSGSAERVGPFKHNGAARAALMAAVGGTVVNTWD